MSNPELVNINNNKVSVTVIENSVNNGEDCIDKAQNNKNAKENSSTSYIVKESENHKELLGTNKNMSSASESNSDSILSKEMYLNGSDNNFPSEIKRGDKCLKFIHDCEPKERLTSGATDEMISFCQGDSANVENIRVNDNYFVSGSQSGQCPPSVVNQSDKKANDVSNDVSLDIQHEKPPLMTNNFNIVPNPNEFNLVGKNNLSLQNPDILNVNQSTDELLAFSDNSIVISNSNAIPQSDNIVSSNYSLSQLQQYISDDEEDSVIEELPVATQQYREATDQMEDSDDDSDSSTSSSTSILVSDSSSGTESEDEYENFGNKPVCKPIKAKGEMDLSDLPPIEDLTISVPEEECIPIGKIYQIVDQLVIVQANKDTPAYDLDTILFTKRGKPLGKVFDVMGPVTEPYYCIRFNSKDHIKEKNISLDQTVYAAPQTQYSKFVFLAQLMQLKGSDASWENDIEPPEIYLDYSDDEQEQRAKKKNYRNKKAVIKTDSDPDEPARKRHSAYVKRMNARNLRLTAARGSQNQNKSKAENGNILWQPNLPPISGASPLPPRPGAPCHRMFGRPPPFEMRVPPSNSTFLSRVGPQFHRPEFPVFPQIFTSPSTSSRGQGLPPFPQHCTSSPGPSPFSQPGASPGPLSFPRPCSSQGPPPFPRPCASPGPSPFSQPGVSPGPLPYPPHPCSSQGPPPFPRPCTSLGGPPLFPGSRASPGHNNLRMPMFSPPPPYGRLQSNQGPNSNSPSWNSSFPKSDNLWANNFPPPPPINGPPPMRNTPPFGSFPFSMDFPRSIPNRAGSHQGSQTNNSSPWSGQFNNQGNSPQFNFNPSVPPPSPSFS